MQHLEQLMHEASQDRNSTLFQGVQRLTYRSTGEWRQPAPLEVLALCADWVVIVDDFLVDTRTGEILNKYERAQFNPEPMTEVQLYATTVRSGEFMNQWLTDNVDRRTIVRADDVKTIHDVMCGAATRDGGKPLVSVPEYKKLAQLAKVIEYRNFIIGSVSDVAKALKLPASTLQRDLKGLVDKGLVTVETSTGGTVERGQIKVSIHPYFAWVSVSSHFDKARKAAMIEWCKTKEGNK